MGKLVLFINGFLFALSIGMGIALYNNSSNKDVDIIKLDQKFGTIPSNPKLEPIVHLANMNKKSFCTAFVIDANYALTASHCVDHEGHLPKEKYKFLDANGNDLGVEVSVVGYHKISDLALLRGNFNNFKLMRIDPYNAPMKKMYLACGFSFGQNHLSCNPLYSSHNEEFKLASHGFLVKGMSGGPVIDLDTQSVVAVNYAVGSGYVYVNPIQGVLGLFGLD